MSSNSLLLPAISIVPFSLILIHTTKPIPGYEYLYVTSIALIYMLMFVQLGWAFYQKFTQVKVGSSLSEASDIYADGISCTNTNIKPSLFSSLLLFNSPTHSSIEATISPVNGHRDQDTTNNNRKVGSHLETSPLIEANYSIESHDQQQQETVKKEINHPYKSLELELEKQLLEETDVESSPAKEEGEEDSSAKWVKVLRQEKNQFSLEVHKKVDCQFHFRLVVDLESTPATTFDFLSDISKRPSWDELWKEAGILERVAPGVSVQYMRTRSFWPTSSRDALVVSFTKKLKENTFMNVTKSIPEYQDYKPRKGDVRMDVDIAGQIIRPDKLGRPNMCRVVQIVDGNLNGWIPGSLISMLSTQAFPISMRKVNKLLKALPPQTESSVISEIENTTTLIASPNTKVQPLRITKISSSGTGANNAGTSVAADGGASISSSTYNNNGSNSSSKNTISKNNQGFLSCSPQKIIKALKFVTKILSKAQPWLVAFMFAAAIYQRVKRGL